VVQLCPQRKGKKPKVEATVTLPLDKQNLVDIVYSYQKEKKRENEEIRMEGEKGPSKESSRLAGGERAGCPSPQPAGTTTELATHKKAVLSLCFQKWGLKAKEGESCRDNQEGW